MKIRVAHAEDIDAIRELARVSWETDYPDILSRENVENAVNDWYGRERLREEFSYPWTHIYVAMDDGELVGFAHAVLAEDEGTILRIYVHPKARRRGIGRALFERTRDELQRHDIDHLNAMVLADNDLGNEFYTDLDLELTEKGETMIGDESFEENRYTLDLE